ncbi:splicing regulatory glutamine/lysine-rich protein 1 [Morus notabilis]|uniref:splicing regulatory glutamine/lysine-rich protein 1 n=1 Tax=Morus notabilis TaxID=981085 RepID=UPI000CED2948|nr:splicing regulatory glutamine/lysine-rich protein 1 [Morus notabilis]
MSRCFPYPPPGYEKNGIRDEALVESIKKLQREGEKAKKERNKEKKWEKKEKDKARENGEAGKEKQSHKKRHREEDQESKKGRDHDKKRKLETENLERSNLTEEHGQPVGSQNSSDSTVNSNKRRNPCSPAESCHNSGSIIRIRLPLQRHKDPEILPSKEQSCSASGRTHNAFVQGRPSEPASRQGKEQGEHHPCSTSTRNLSQVAKNSRLSKEHRSTTKSVDLSQNSRLIKENHCSTTKSVDLSQNSRLIKEKHCPTTKSVDLSQNSRLIKEKHCPTTKSVDISHKAESIPMLSTSPHFPPLPPMVSQYRDLFENWVPPPMQDDCMELGVETWLFKSKQDHKNGVERCKDGGDILSHEPSTLWPRAHYLPSVDIFALPYAVPL